METPPGGVAVSYIQVANNLQRARFLGRFLAVDALIPNRIPFDDPTV